MGADDAYPEERPVRKVSISSFEIDASEITNRQFLNFIEETGYITDAERPQPGFDVPGGAVLSPPSAGSPSSWRFVEGAQIGSIQRDLIAQLRDEAWSLSCKSHSMMRGLMRIGQVGVFLLKPNGSLRRRLGQIHYMFGG